MMTKKFKYLLISVCFLSCTISVYAQSTVYFFTPSTINNVCPITMNGDSIFNLRGPYKKTINNAIISIPLDMYAAAYKKCVFKEEGKVIFVANYKAQDPEKPGISEFLSEIQINLFEGSVHYIRLAAKGMYDMELKELTEKESKKYFKKSVELPEYIQE